MWSKTLKISDNNGADGLLNIGLNTDDNFGSSVSYLDNTLVVGAVGDSGGGYLRGAVYIFEKTNGVWSKTLKISDNGGGGGKLNVDLDNWDAFGISVSYSDDTLVVGAVGDDDGGTRQRSSIYL